MNLTKLADNLRASLVETTQDETFNFVLQIYYFIPITYVTLLYFLYAPYGKFQSDWVIPNIPGKPGWVFMEIWSPLIFLYYFLAPPSNPNTPAQIILGTLWMVHYVNRVVIYTYRAPGISPMNLSTILCGMMFNVINGYSNARLYKYISCPTYFGETVEWIGFAIAAWYSPPAILFAFTTPSNLFPRAQRTHRWYLQKFKEDYPRERKAVIPFVW
ncbi:11136_t:CDS:2 [Paraglomus occultum]|uniref:11136_t:CDS:1 n=1 Tax=Paraglomus occultum TaxID=144539 RepID=A0A9N9FSN6_9GLOM|nr:11136_t:CDS:2 [Paraglomus occultum]